MESEIEVFDLGRLFLGEEPPWFLLEVVFRTAFMFVYTFVLVRATGKRGVGDLSPFELLLVVALGSAVGDPMFYADVPLLHAMAVVTVIVLLQRLVSLAVDHSEPIERFIESSPTRLVTAGVVDCDALRGEHLAKDELFMLLREEGVEQLGQVKRAYLEPSGRVSVWLFPSDEVEAGLPLMPRDDPDCPQPRPAQETALSDETMACVVCGAVRRPTPGQAFGPCPACEATEGWTEASSVTGAARRDDGMGRSRRRRGLLDR